MQRRCLDCIHFEPDQQTVGFRGDPPTAGWCRRRAPIFLSRDHQAVFPRVSADDWCGEFDSRGGYIVASMAITDTPEPIQTQDVPPLKTR